MSASTIDAVNVDAEVKERVEAALDYLAWDLGIVLDVRWKDLKGQYGRFLPSNPDVIEMHPDQDGEEIDTALHEGFHAKQYRDGKHVPSWLNHGDPSGTERAAREYARRKTPIVEAVLPDLLERRSALKQAVKRSLVLEPLSGKSKCGCSGDAPDLDTFLDSCAKLRRADYPFRNRVHSLKSLVGWERAVYEDDQHAIKAMASNPDKWLTPLILRERDQYESDLCERPQYSGTPLCQTREEKAEVVGEHGLQTLLRALQQARREIRGAV